MYMRILIDNFDICLGVIKFFIYDFLWMKICVRLFILKCFYIKLFVILGVFIFYYDIIFCGFYNLFWGCCVG